MQISTNYYVPKFNKNTKQNNISNPNFKAKITGEKVAASVAGLVEMVLAIQNGNKVQQFDKKNALLPKGNGVCLDSNFKNLSNDNSGNMEDSEPVRPTSQVSRKGVNENIELSPKGQKILEELNELLNRENLDVEKFNKLHDEVKQLENPAEILAISLKLADIVKETINTEEPTSVDEQSVAWEKIKVGDEEMEAAVTKNEDGTVNVDLSKCRKMNTDDTYEEFAISTKEDLLHSDYESLIRLKKEKSSDSFEKSYDLFAKDPFGRNKFKMAFEPISKSRIPIPQVHARPKEPSTLISQLSSKIKDFLRTLKPTVKTTPKTQPADTKPAETKPVVNIEFKPDNTDEYKFTLQEFQKVLCGENCQHTTITTPDGTIYIEITNTYEPQYNGHHWYNIYKYDKDGNFVGLTENVIETDAEAFYPKGSKRIRSNIDFDSKQWTYTDEVRDGKKWTTAKFDMSRVKYKGELPTQVLSEKSKTTLDKINEEITLQKIEQAEKSGQKPKIIEFKPDETDEYKFTLQEFEADILGNELCSYNKIVDKDGNTYIEITKSYMTSWGSHDHIYNIYKYDKDGIFVGLAEDVSEMIAKKFYEANTDERKTLCGNWNPSLWNSEEIDPDSREHKMIFTISAIKYKGKLSSKQLAKLAKGIDEKFKKTNASQKEILSHLSDEEKIKYAKGKLATMSGGYDDRYQWTDEEIETLVPYYMENPKAIEDVMERYGWRCFDGAAEVELAILNVKSKGEVIRFAEMGYVGNEIITAVELNTKTNGLAMEFAKIPQSTNLDGKEKSGCKGLSEVIELCELSEKYGKELVMNYAKLKYIQRYYSNASYTGSYNSNEIKTILELGEKYGHDVIFEIARKTNERVEEITKYAELNLETNGLLLELISGDMEYQLNPQLHEINRREYKNWKQLTDLASKDEETKQCVKELMNYRDKYGKMKFSSDDIKSMIENGWYPKYKDDLTEFIDKANEPLPKDTEREYLYTLNPAEILEAYATYKDAVIELSRIEFGEKDAWRSGAQKHFQGKQIVQIAETRATNKADVEFILEHYFTKKENGHYINTSDNSTNYRQISKIIDLFKLNKESNGDAVKVVKLGCDFYFEYHKDGNQAKIELYRRMVEKNKSEDDMRKVFGLIMNDCQTDEYKLTAKLVDKDYEINSIGRILKVYDYGAQQACVDYLIDRGDVASNLIADIAEYVKYDSEKFSFVKYAIEDLNRNAQSVAKIIAAINSVNADLTKELLKKAELSDEQVYNIVRGITKKEHIDMANELLTQNEEITKWALLNFNNGHSIYTLSHLKATQEKLLNQKEKKEVTISDIEADNIKPLTELGVPEPMAKNAYSKYFTDSSGNVDILKRDAVCALIKAYGITRSVSKDGKPRTNPNISPNDIKEIFGLASVGLTGGATGEFRPEIIRDIITLKQAGIEDKVLARNIACIKNMSSAEMKTRIKDRKKVAFQIDNLPTEVKEQLKAKGINLEEIKEAALERKSIEGRTIVQVPEQKVQVRKLSDIVGIEKTVIDKFKQELSSNEWATTETLAEWAKKKIENDICKYDAETGEFSINEKLLATGQYSNINNARIEGLKKWVEWLNSEDCHYKDNAFAHLLFLDGLAREMKPDCAYTPPPVSAGAFEAVYTAASAENSDTPTKVMAAYHRQKAFEKYTTEEVELNGIKGRWVTIPRSRRGEQDYDDHIAMVQALSEGSSWCLRYNNAHGYLQGGNLHFFVDTEGKSQVAINETDGKITQIQKRYDQDSTVPVPYAEVIQAWKEKHEYSGHERPIQTALDQKKKFDALKNKLQVLMDKEDYIGVFSEIGIEANQAEDGTIILSGYNAIVDDKYTLSDLGVDEDKLMQNVSYIKFNMLLEGSKLKKLPKLKAVGSEIRFGDSNVKDFGALQSIAGKKITWFTKNKIN